MSIENESVSPYQCFDEGSSHNYINESNIFVSENSQKEDEGKCFVDFLNQLDGESDFDNTSLQLSNIDINQANYYFKPKRKPPKFLNQYYLTGDTIGRGSYGKVKDVIDLRTLKRYAIKVVCQMKIKKIPGGMQHVESEISLLRSLNHPNIVKLIDDFTESDPVRRCIVMEFCMGSIHDLQTNGINEISNQFRCLPEWQAHCYFKQIINGVEYLHSQRLVHKDLKPGNFLLTECEQVKITDFGVSERFNIFSINSYITGGHTTPAIQPPELAGGAKNVCGYKLDIYGAGISLYFMLCGRLPFQNNNIIFIFDEIVAGKYDIPEHLSANAADLIHEMMRKDIKMRISIRKLRRHDWFTNSHHNHEVNVDALPGYYGVPNCCDNKVHPQFHLNYSARSPSKENLYVLARSLQNEETQNEMSLSTLPDTAVSPITGSRAVMPLSVTRGLRTYYDWPLTYLEEQKLINDQLIISDNVGPQHSDTANTTTNIIDEKIAVSVSKFYDRIDSSPTYIIDDDLLLFQPNPVEISYKLEPDVINFLEQNPTDKPPPQKTFYINSQSENSSNLIKHSPQQHQYQSQTSHSLDTQNIRQSISDHQMTLAASNNFGEHDDDLKHHQYQHYSSGSSTIQPHSNRSLDHKQRHQTQFTKKSPSILSSPITYFRTRKHNNKTATSKSSSHCSPS